MKIPAANARLLVLIGLSVLCYSVMMGGRLAISLTALKLTGSTATAGVLMGIYAAVPIVIGLHAGRLIDRIGLRRPLVWTAALALAGIVLPGLWQGLPALAAASVLNGFAFTVAAMALGNAAALLGTPEQRTSNIGWVFLGNAAGFALGPLMAGFGIDHLGHRACFLLLALLPLASLILMAACIRQVPQGAMPTRHRRPSGGLLRALNQPAMRPLVIVQVLAGSCLETFYFIVPLHGAQSGLSASTIGVITSCAFVANCTARTLLPVWTRHRDERRVMSVVFFIAAVSIFPFALTAQPWLLMLFAAGVGVCHGAAFPILTSLIYTASPPGRQGELSGARVMLTAGGVSFNQFLAGGLSSLFGLVPVTWLVAAMALAAGWYSRRQAQALDPRRETFKQRR